MAQKRLGDSRSSSEQFDSYDMSGRRFIKFLISALYNIDKRIRVLESKAPITKPQFRASIKQYYEDV